MAATVIFRANVRGARRSGHQLRSAGREIQAILLDEFAQLAPTGLRVARQFAPHHRGNLERGLQARVRSYGGRITIEIVSTARSEDGYDYLPVTRFGHRVPFIFPVKAKALKIPTAEGVIFRKWVRGYRPTHDWVEEAYLAMDDELDRVARDIGRAVDRRLL